MPPWVFIAGRVGNSIVVAVIMLVLLATIGRVFYGVPIPWSGTAAILVTLVDRAQRPSAASASP